MLADYSFRQVSGFAHVLSISLEWIKKLLPETPESAGEDILLRLADHPPHLLEDIGFRQVRLDDGSKVWERDGLRLEPMSHVSMPDPIRS